MIAFVWAQGCLPDRSNDSEKTAANVATGHGLPEQTLYLNPQMVTRLYYGGFASLLLIKPAATGARYSKH